MTGLESPAVLAARLQGSRDAFVSLLADGDAFTRHDGAAWLPFRALTRLTANGAIVWSSTPLPDALVVAR